MIKTKKEQVKENDGWQGHKEKFKKMFKEDIEKKGSVDEDGNIVLTGINDTVKLTKQKKESPYQIFSIKGQIENFHKNNPFFYDKSKLFFTWNDELKKYELSDEVDMLNKISENLGMDTINSKNKTELISGFQQVGRKNVPKDTPSSWVQYKNKVCDFKTGEIFEASPEYFITNPIPWDIGESEETPTIDNLFIEWVGEENKQSLYEIIAYCSSSEQFMQRIITLVGGGANGKGTFVKLVKKFMGEKNMCSSELKELSTNQFETSVIYKKLVCVMGEVSHDDLKNTNQIKKIAGEDDLRFCFKGKTPFSDRSITTALIQTNSLSRTPDKTMGFYRKFHILDFPNQFTEIKQGIIENIPEEEFDNLAKKTLRILKELYTTQKFHNEGTFQERMDRYEERSNPVLKFIESFCVESVSQNTELKKFTNKFNEYAKSNHLRIMSVRQISKILREEGFEMGKRSFDIGGLTTSKQVILNLEIMLPKNTRNTENTEHSTRFPCKVSTSNFGISGISGINYNDISNPTQEDIINFYEKQGYPPEELKEILRVNE